MKDNMKLWNQVCVSDPKITKPIPGKFKLTAIDAQSQVKNATELFGPFGIGFGISQEVRHFEDNRMYYSGVLWYMLDGVKGEVAICSDVVMQRDCMKTAQTDALTKGLSRIGFNSDIFEGTFDGNKYLNKPQPKLGQITKAKPNLDTVSTKPVSKAFPLTETHDPNTKVQFGYSDLKKKTYAQCTKAELLKNKEYFGDATSDKDDKMIKHINTVDVMLAGITGE